MGKNYISEIFVTVDVVVVRRLSKHIEILLIQRKNEPFKGQWALPGGFVDKHEDLETAAMRELAEETNIKVESLAQVKAYGSPHRDPRGYMVTVAYSTAVGTHVKPLAADDAKEVMWFNINDLPSLAFDHAQIIHDAINLFK